MSKPTVAVLLTNFRRPQNIPLVVSRIRMQRGVSVSMLMLDNGNLPRRLAHGIHEVVRPGRNVGVFERWRLAERTDAEFVVSIDDDRALAMPDSLWLATRAMSDDPDSIVCAEGVQFGDPARPYSTGRHVREGRVDVAKGFFLLTRAEFIRESVLPAAEGFPPESLFASDDVFVSSRSREKWAIDIPNKELWDGAGLSDAPSWYEKRDAASLRFFGS